MRKVLIATIVAMVLFAVGAFAANLDLNAEDVASGQAEVGACDAEPEVAFTVGDYDEDLNDWRITGATVTVIAACEGAVVQVVALGASDAELGTSDKQPVNASGVATVTFPAPGPAVNPVVETAVLLDGVVVS